MEIFCYSNSVYRLMETVRGFKIIFKSMDKRCFAAALLRIIRVSSNSTFFMRKLKKESLHAYLHGPLTGTYSRPASHWHLQQASLSQAPTAGQMNSLSIIKINLSPFEMKAPNTV
jgi:hypothetical protein